MSDARPKASEIFGSFGPSHPDRNNDGSCWGFRWTGQAFTHCDTCGEPYWEHDFDVSMENDGWHRRPITVASKAKVKAKWGPDA